MNKFLKKLTLIVLTSPFLISNAQNVDYSVVSVNEEKGISFTKITSDNDYVCMPQVTRERNGKLSWLSNRIIDISPDGQKLAYISYRNNTTNIFIKDLGKVGGAMQRTNRKNVLDFSYSPDGNNICFTEIIGNSNRIFTTNADKGYMCRQITNNDLDYTPIYSSDMTQIYFTRQEVQAFSIWSYNVTDNFLSNITNGSNPYPIKGENAIVCVRPTDDDRNEIWKINYETGVEECIISDFDHSFSTPSISPNGEWLLFVGSSVIDGGSFKYANTDIFVCRMDGTDFTQITYHAADDISPAWSHDGKFIYFISQRGSSTGTANVWRINFDY